MDSIKLFIVIFILSISTIGGYYYYQQYTKNNTIAPTTAPTTSTPTTTPTSTPTTTPTTTTPVVAPAVQPTTPPAVAPVNCYGEWTSWTPCNKTCGGGTQNRTYNIKTIGNSAPCSFKDGETQNQTCNTQPCAIDCVGNWSDWSSCGAYTPGSQRRTYVISQPASNGGKACYVRDGEIETKGCTVHCIGSWSNWSECSGCSGTQTRRYTVSQAAIGGGMTCPATDGTIETQNCTKDCNCQLSDWSSWSGCSNCTRVCPAGSTMAGALCISSCPPGYRDDGLFCTSGSSAVAKTTSVPIMIGKQIRTRNVLQPKTGNGTACDITYQEQPCNC